MLRISLAITSAVALLGGLVSCAPAPDPNLHAVKVSFAFRYNGRAYATSYLTTMKDQTGFGAGGSWTPWERWSPARQRAAVSLPDGSLLILFPDWNVRGDGLPRAAYGTPVQWAWLDSVKAPKEIVSGGDFTRRSPDETRQVDFPWFDPTATVEPVSDSLLPAAAHADQSPDEAGVIAFSNIGGIAGKDFDGALYSGVKLAPVEANELSPRAKVSDWAPASGCEVAAVVGAPATLLFRPTARELMSDGSVWRADAGPAPHEPMVMYPTGQDVAITDGFDVSRYDNLVLRMVRSVSMAGRTCSGIVPAPNARAELIRYPDGKLVLLAPSSEITLVRR